MEAWVSLQVRKADAFQFSLAERQIEAHVADPQRAEADLRAMERHNDAAHKAYAVALRAEASADALAERTASCRMGFAPRAASRKAEPSLSLTSSASVPFA